MLSTMCTMCPAGSGGRLAADTLRLRLNGFRAPFRDHFATVSDRFSGSWCRFLESWGQDGEDGEKMGKKRGKMGEKWPKESGSNDGLTANAEYMRSGVTQATFRGHPFGGTDHSSIERRRPLLLPPFWTVAEPTPGLLVPLSGILASRRRNQRKNGGKTSKNGRDTAI